MRHVDWFGKLLCEVGAHRGCLNEFIRSPVPTDSPLRLRDGWNERRGDFMSSTCLTNIGFWQRTIFRFSWWADEVNITSLPSVTTPLSLGAICWLGSTSRWDSAPVRGRFFQRSCPRVVVVRDIHLRFKYVATGPQQQQKLQSVDGTVYIKSVDILMV